MSCYCDFSDYESPSAFSVATHKARKPHKCSECGRTINPGETYKKTWGVWDGEPDTFCMCPDCMGLLDYMQAHFPKCFCWAYTELRNAALDQLREYAREAPGLFFGGARFIVRGRSKRRAEKAIQNEVAA